MNRKVLITEEINSIGKNLLKEHGFEIRMGSGVDEAAIIREAADCCAILTRNAIITENIMKNCPLLRVISMHGVGVNGIDINSATNLGIQVTNAAHSNQNSVAEYTIGLLLLLSKHIIRYHNELKAGNWNVRSICGSELKGKTLGIIGMGNIGTEVAKKAYYGFGMDIIGYKRRLVQPEKTDYGLLTNDMNIVLRSADYLTLHVPATASTAHMIGEKQLSLMKQDACLINTARGEVVDEAALAQFLKNKKLAGAAIDVFDGGIPSMDNPLLHLDSVIVSPHTAAFTVQALEQMSYQSALGIIETIEGRTLTYPVNMLQNTIADIAS